MPIAIPGSPPASSGKPQIDPRTGKPVTPAYAPYGNSGLYYDPSKPVNQQTSAVLANADLYQPTYGSASDQLAGLYSQQWQDYLKRFAPEEDIQLGLMTDSSNAQERQKAIGAVNSAYKRSEGDYERQAMGYGITLSPEQKASYAQRSDTQKGLDLTSAFNRTEARQQDRAYGSLPTFIAPQVGGAGGISPSSGSLGGYQ